MFFPGSGYASPFRPRNGYFLSRRTVQEPYSAPEAPFFPVEAGHDQREWKTAPAQGVGGDHVQPRFQ